MEYAELLKKYELLSAEYENLKQENEWLRRQLPVILKETRSQEVKSAAVDRSNVETKQSEAHEKVKMFMFLFKGRDDVYAKRWENKQGKAGYAPVCWNEWRSGICKKPKGKCAECEHKAYAILDENVIEQHLRGNLVLGLYPMCQDETCHFLAIDFDDDGWQEDVAFVRSICREEGIPIAVERSRSGNGAHAWFFFSQPIAASVARKFGSALLTFAMNQRHEIGFFSYDRLFPNQDTMPKGGFGNLIALPLQPNARKAGNSVFVDEKFEPYVDQWQYLRDIAKLSPEEIDHFFRHLCKGDELGTLRKEVDAEETKERPWEPGATELFHATAKDFPKQVEMVKGNMLYIDKKAFSQRALNCLKRLAAFRNPEFYKAQAMRLPTFNKPRIIGCSQETERYLCLPRGCEEEVVTLLAESDSVIQWQDERNSGKRIRVEFNGELRSEQQAAAAALLKYDTGVLAATTAFGKTVVAANLIAQRKVNTLILVHRQQLAAQWRSRLAEFLTIDEELPVLEVKRGRKKERSLIGQLGAGKNALSGIIDVAVIQSMHSGDEIKACAREYGMVIVDECHHISAFSFEAVLRQVNARYVYGLTATPTRKDGHQPIIFMQCGPIRYRVDARKQAEERPFEHYIIPRFTGFQAPIEKNESDMTIQELYNEIMQSEVRNQLIVDDVINNYKRGRHALILTERTVHVEELRKRLLPAIPDVVVMTGGKGAKETRRIQTLLADMPEDKPLTIIATGKYIGEGFDEARLDTLFLAMPISWKGTLQQYAGRLHRLWSEKKEVQIYDYVDNQVRMLEKMYNRRLTGYGAIGYKGKGEPLAQETGNIIFNQNSFIAVYSNDLTHAANEIMIVSPFISKTRVGKMIQFLNAALARNVKVVVLTRPVESYTGKSSVMIKSIHDRLMQSGVKLLTKANIHQKFAILDQKIVWYGSINLLSYGSSEESIMRLDNSNVASELLKSMK